MRTSSVFAAVTAGRRPPLRALGLGGPEAVVGQLALEFANGGEGLHHKLYGGQQFVGARVAGGEVHRGERAVVDAQREAVAVDDVEHVEDVAGAAYEAEPLGDVHGVPGPGVVEECPDVSVARRQTIV
ncbi:hypothetical protein ACWCPJ_39000 [Streptomyces collinus]